MIEKILDSEQKLLTAIKNSDVEVLDLLLHDNLLFNIPSGATITKEMDLESYRSGAMHIEEISSEEPMVEFIGDTAIVAVTIYLKGTYTGQSLEGTFRYLRVWKQVENNWKVIAGSCLPL